MHLQKEYPDKFVDLSMCSTTVVGQQNVLPLQLKHNKGYDMVGGFYNIHHWYTFTCGSHTQTPDWLRMQLLGEDQNGLFTQVLKESDTDTLVVEPNLMSENQNYILLCVGMHEINEGLVSRSLSTVWFEEDFNFYVYNNDEDTDTVVPF